MKKRLNYWLALALGVGFMACSEKAKEEVTPELPEEEVIEVEDAIISGFSPAYMIEGEIVEIQIEGAHFSEDLSEVKVVLLNEAGDEIDLAVQSVSNTLIKATAENIETTAEYTIKVKIKEQEVAAATKFTVYGKVFVDPIVGSSLEDGSYTIEVGGYLLLTGGHFSEAEEANQLWLVDEEGNETAAIMIVSKSDRLGFLVPEDLPLGNYQMKIVTNIQELLVEYRLIVEEASPRIESISPLSIFAGEEFTISGKFFSAVAEENEVSIQKGYFTTRLNIVSATETELVVSTGSELEAGEYSLSVSKNGKTTYFNSEKLEVKPSPTMPVITSLNKTGFSKGETIIITGENLRKENAVTNINFIPFYGGTTIARSATANEAGTEITFTIPDTFPSGSYEILVEVDWEFSESYGDIIRIQ